MAQSFLALAHLSAELGGLLVGQPERAAVVFLHGSGPQHQDIDAAVSLAAGAQRPRYRPGLVAGLPWLQPGKISALEIGEDLVGDAGVNVRFLGHCRSPFFGDGDDACVRQRRGASRRCGRFADEGAASGWPLGRFTGPAGGRCAG
jgi:hypothetical protein